jgi:hypothetical protein
MILPPSILLAALFAQPAQTQFPGTEIVVIDQCSRTIPNAIVRIKPVAPHDREEETLAATEFPGFYFTDRIPSDTTMIRVSVTVPGDVPNNTVNPPIQYRRRIVWRQPHLEAALINREPWSRPSTVAPQIFNPYVVPPACRTEPNDRRIVAVPSIARQTSMTNAAMAKRVRSKSLFDVPERIRIPFADDLPVHAVPIVSATDRP